MSARVLASVKEDRRDPHLPIRSLQTIIGVILPHRIIQNQIGCSDRGRCASSVPIYFENVDHLARREMCQLRHREDVEQGPASTPTLLMTWFARPALRLG